MEQFFDYLVWPYIITVVLFGYSVKRYVTTSKIKLPVDIRLIVFGIGLILAALFYFMYEADLASYVVSFTVATSMYDLIIKWIINKLEKFFTDDSKSPADLG